MFEYIFFVRFVTLGICLLLSYAFYRIFVFIFSDKNKKHQLTHENETINLMANNELSTIKPSRIPFDVSNTQKLMYNKHGQAYYIPEKETSIPQTEKWTQPITGATTPNYSGFIIMSGKSAIGNLPMNSNPWFSPMNMKSIQGTTVGHQGSSGTSGTSGTSGVMGIRTVQEDIQRIKNHYRKAEEKEKEYPYGKPNPDLERMRQLMGKL